MPQSPATRVACSRSATSHVIHCFSGTVHTWRPYGLASFGATYQRSCATNNVAQVGRNCVTIVDRGGFTETTPNKSRDSYRQLFFGTSHRAQKHMTRCYLGPLSHELILPTDGRVLSDRWTQSPDGVVMRKISLRRCGGMLSCADLSCFASIHWDHQMLVSIARSGASRVPHTTAIF
jgi:hypothetical protein